MHCIDNPMFHRITRLVALSCTALWLSACGNRQVAVDAPSNEGAATVRPEAGSVSPTQASDAAVVPRVGAVDGTRVPGSALLAAPVTPRNRKELQLQFAHRLVAAHPDTSYTARAPDRLSAIPVLEVELHGDGSVRRIKVLRTPSTGDEATALAIAAVRRAAPFGNVSKLPRPWMVVETFLFDDQMRFKPRTLDID